MTHYQVTSMEAKLAFFSNGSLNDDKHNDTSIVRHSLFIKTNFLEFHHPFYLSEEN
jgi:hypothetical protein